MITLYLARHGQTVENLSRIFQGHLPGTLTEETGSGYRATGCWEPAAALAADYVVEGNRLGTLDRAVCGECRFKQSSCWSGNSPDDVRSGRCFLGLSVAAL